MMNRLFLLLCILLAGCGPAWFDTTPTPVNTSVPTAAVYPTITPETKTIAAVYIVLDSLHLRECPRADCDAIFQMPQGTVLALHNETGGWALVQVIGIPPGYQALSVFENVRGWCSAEWIEAR